MKKIDEFEKMEELQGQREQLAVALQVISAPPCPDISRDGTAAMPGLPLHR